MDLSSSSLHNNSVALIPPCLPLSPIHGIRGFCNGFILLCHLDYRLFIWNPSIGAHKKLPLPPIDALSLPKGIDPFLCGFGYDASTDDYLVFLATFDIARKIHYELFSLRTNAWNTIIEGNDFTYDLCFLNSTGILSNGVLHWLAFSHDIETIVILAFDLKEKSFSEVSMPSSVVDFYNKHYTFSDLCVLDGYLCLSFPRDNATELWVMNEYKVPSSWKKTVELCMTSEAINPTYYPKHYFSPRYTTKCGDIVGVNGASRVVKFNAIGQLLEHHSYLCAYRCEAIMYTESLLSFLS